MALFLIFLSLNSFAQELPEHLQEMLVKSQDYFVIYSQKTPTEIEDGKYDETEYLLFSHIDQINGLDVIFTKDEIKTLKMKMVSLISQSFQAEQMEAIARLGRTSQLNKIKLQLILNSLWNINWAGYPLLNSPVTAN